MKHTLPLIIIALLALVAQTASAQSEQLQAGLDLLDRAADVREDQPELARRLASDAAAIIERSLPDEQSNSPLAQRALGNAHLISGDIGRAVLAYRRALDADPTDPLAATSLDHARSEIDVAAPESSNQAWSMAVERARAAMPRKALFFTSLSAFTAACVLLAISIQLPNADKARTITRVISWSLLSVAAVPAFALLADARASNSNQHAAVVVASTTARSGPDESVYPAVFETPVLPGTEVVIQESRPGWNLVSIGSAKGWLPESRIERVRANAADPYSPE